MQPILQSHSPSVLPSTATFHQRSLPGGVHCQSQKIGQILHQFEFRLSITIGLRYYIGRPIIWYIPSVIAPRELNLFSFACTVCDVAVIIFGKNEHD